MYRQKGLSLVELMVAIALGLVLMGGVIQLFLSSRVVFSTQQALSRVQENGRFAIEFITRDLRQAGYAGCANQLVSDLAGAGVSFWNDYTLASEDMRAVQGFVNNIAGVALAPAPLPGDILVVRYADGIPGILAEDNAAGQLVLSGNLEGGCLNGLCQNGVAVVTNCAAGRVFSINGLANLGANTRLTHAGGWPASDLPVPSEIFIAGGEVLPLFTVVYYVANNPAGQPSLYRAVNGVNGVEMVEGVERMSLRFRNSNGDYLASAAVANWATINGVRVELLLQANENNMLDQAQTYTLGGEVTDPFADRRYRQVFGTTVAVRGRI